MTFDGGTRRDGGPGQWRVRLRDAIPRDVFWSANISALSPTGAAAGFSGRWDGGGPPFQSARTRGLEMPMGVS